MSGLSAGMPRNFRKVIPDVVIVRSKGHNELMTENEAHYWHDDDGAKLADMPEWRVRLSNGTVVGNFRSVTAVFRWCEANGLTPKVLS